MKKLLIILLLLSTIPIFSQNHFIGIQGGASWTNVNSDNFLSSNKNRAGFMAGLNYECQFKNNFQLGLAIVYAQKGFRNDITFTDINGMPISDGEIDFNYDYLSLPIKAGYSIGEKFKGFINVALVPLFFLRSEIKNPLFDETNNIDDISDQVTPIDLGGMLELGGSYKLSEQFLLFAACNYQQSFTSFTNDDYFPNTEAYHYGVTTAVGLKYKL